MVEARPPKPTQSGALRLAGAGVELAGTVAVACLLGYWIDNRFGTSPWGIVILAAIGVVGGLYNLVRRSVHEMLRSPKPPRPGGGPEGPPAERGRTDV
ncbi:MAG TPA: AtpZ/AtpI family protein [Phycisphaerae bacterium]|jgi:F0F1-type ATP synthase assembly protein I|nr:AtpZ/AtpI family protein [Phycisphaerae bacterium]HOB75228.1 AtpZ/AtpI family protein [Phycisphaerae bacterium]HOJ54709.1 AtpZ/AtpI family protein [Phycisphaerae bacterium]HOL25941.1 AtpZ/AtpI family protein [Phycisphaerae bacterium]HPP19487.1 AtpZ/AtpI family protein [Phycisphaerae bacterium]